MGYKTQDDIPQVRSHAREPLFAYMQIQLWSKACTKPSSFYNKGNPGWHTNKDVDETFEKGLRITKNHFFITTGLISTTMSSYCSSIMGQLARLPLECLYVSLPPEVVDQGNLARYADLIPH